MHATPLNSKEWIQEGLPSYFDNPVENLKFLETLDDHEGEVYTLGYIQCCHQVQEALGDSKRKFLEKAMDDNYDHDKLLSFVKLLDSLEESLEDRIKFLQNEMTYKMK